MKKSAAKGFCGVFTPRGATLLIIPFTVIVCVFVIGTVHEKSWGRITLLSATATEFDSSRLILEQSSQWQTVRMRVTAYCPCRKCCGEHSDGHTACLHKIRSGDAFVAADKRYCFGTEMIITGYNDGEPVKVLDRGGAISGDRLDVFFHSHEEALEWGVKYLDVRVRRCPQAQ